MVILLGPQPRKSGVVARGRWSIASSRQCAEADRHPTAQQPSATRLEFPCVAAKAHWKDEPDDHDYPAAESYLSLVMSPAQAKQLGTRLRRMGIEHFKAKDLLRASGLPLLDANNVYVAKDLDKVKQGNRLSPVLLIRGNLKAHTPLIVADGYHRICASCHLDEDSDIPCRVTELPGS
jgi:hypothetical protein